MNTDPQVVVTSPCHKVAGLVERWRLDYAAEYTGGVMLLRCGSLLDTPGWPGGRRHGCGEKYAIRVEDLCALLGVAW